jgi:hypothetical protein
LDLVEFIMIDDTHVGTFARNDIDEASRLERTNRLPDRISAHSESFSELPLDQSGPLRKLTLDDHRPNLTDNDLSQRLMIHVMHYVLHLPQRRIDEDPSDPAVPAMHCRAPRAPSVICLLPITASAAIAESTAVLPAHNVSSPVAIAS